VAVATTKTGAVFSCIQVSSVPSTRRDVPPSRSPVANPFSTSSIHSTHGATVSASRSARLTRSSDSPTSEPNSAPTSSRSNGSRYSPPIILAVSDLPVPGMPISARPLGAGSP
jgi:hypothetical protein